MRGTAEKRHVNRDLRIAIFYRTFAVAGDMTLTVHSVSGSCPAKAGRPVTPVRSVELMLSPVYRAVLTGSPGQAGR